MALADEGGGMMGTAANVFAISQFWTSGALWMHGDHVNSIVTGILGTAAFAIYEWLRD